MNLGDLQAAIPTPWNTEGCLAEGPLKRNVDHCAELKSDGVYIKNGDGEFYAIKLEEFWYLITAFVRRLRRTALVLLHDDDWLVERVMKFAARFDVIAPSLHRLHCV